MIYCMHKSLHQRFLSIQQISVSLDSLHYQADISKILPICLLCAIHHVKTLMTPLVTLFSNLNNSIPISLFIGQLIWTF